MVAAIEAVSQGVAVVPVSAATGENIGALDVHLGRGRTAGLVGSSGVGKSSLVNRILGQQLQPAAPVGDDDRGRHTTTRRELIPVPGGAVEAAVASGQLDPARLASYHKLLRELAAAERRRDPLAQARYRQRWKAVHMDLRRRARTDPKLRS